MTTSAGAVAISPSETRRVRSRTLDVMVTGCHRLAAQGCTGEPHRCILFWARCGRLFIDLWRLNLQQESAMSFRHRVVFVLVWLMSLGVAGKVLSAALSALPVR